MGGEICLPVPKTEKTSDYLGFVGLVTNRVPPVIPLSTTCLHVNIVCKDDPGRDFRSPRGFVPRFGQRHLAEGIRRAPTTWSSKRVRSVLGPGRCGWGKDRRRPTDTGRGPGPLFTPTRVSSRSWTDSVPGLPTPTCMGLTTTTTTRGVGRVTTPSTVGPSSPGEEGPPRAVTTTSTVSVPLLGRDTCLTPGIRVP